MTNVGVSNRTVSGCPICNSSPDAVFVACPSCLAEYTEDGTYSADCDLCDGRGVVVERSARH